MILLYYDRITKVLIIFGCVTLILGIIRIATRKRMKRKFFMKSELAMVGIAVILGVFGFFGKMAEVEHADTKMYSKAALLRDFNQLKMVVLNENPLYYADRSELENSFEKAKQQINGEMTEEEFYRIVNPLVVNIQCGHTNLSISKALQKNRKTNAKFLPTKVYVKDSTLIDLQNQETIISINEIPSETIIQTLLKNISHDGDNLAGAYYILNLYFATKYYDFIEQPEEFLIKYQKHDGTIETKTVQAVSNPAYNVSAWDLRMKQYKDGDYYSSSFEGDTATLRIRVFMEEKQSFASFLKEFFGKVEENHCKRVIIDVRGNFGGDPRMAKELLSYLITEPLDYFVSKLSLLEKITGYGKKISPKYDQIPFETELVIDGACFSTCGHFAAIYQSMELGKITGEPTGGGSICTDGSKDIVLYETGLRLHYSTQVFQVNAECERTNVVCPNE